MLSCVMYFYQFLLQCKSPLETTFGVGFEIIQFYFVPVFNCDIKKDRLWNRIFTCIVQDSVLSVTIKVAPSSFLGSHFRF